MTNLKNKVRSQLKRKFSPKQEYVPAVLGDGNGNTTIPGYRYLCYARVSGREVPLVVRNMRTPHVHGLRVWVGADELDSRIIQVMGNRIDGGAEPTNNPAVGPHAFSHTWGQSDPVFIDTKQITELNVYAAGGLVVGVKAGMVPNGISGFVSVSGTSINLTSRVPVSDMRFVLVQVSGTGVVSAKNGDTFDQSLYSLDNIPPPDEGCYPLAAVRLRSGQATISNNATDPDILDLRFVSGAALIHNHDDRYYTETELNTPGAGGEVHWDNIIEKPPMEVTLFLHEEDADVAGYEQLLEHPSDDPENIDSAVLVDVDTEYVIDEYITYPTIGWGRTFIQGGSWQFMTWTRVDSAVGDTRLVIRVYKRDQEGNETELFNVTSDEINNTSVEEVDIEIVQPDIFLDETDRLVVKYFGKSTSVADRTIYLYYEGAVNYSHIHLPGAGISSGGTSFIGMSDTPSTYTGAGGYTLKVTAGEDGVEFIDDPAIPEAFTDLSDTPADYTDDAGKFVRVNATEDGLEFADVSGGVDEFIELTDAPSDYTDQAGKVVRVNETEDGLEFGNVAWDEVIDKPTTFNRFYPKENYLSIYKNFFGGWVDVNLPDADEEVLVGIFNPLVGMGLESIPAGTWTVQTVASGSTSVSGALSLIAKVYHLDEIGNPTLLFSQEEQLPGTNPSFETVVFTDLQNELALTPYDSLALIFYAKSTQGGADTIRLLAYPQVAGGVETYLEIPPVIFINSGVSALGQLQDVFIDDVVEGQSLIFDSTPFGGQWIPYDPASGVTVEETDGAPSIAADKIVFGPGTVSDLGGGDARVTGLYVPTGGEFLTDSAGNSWQQGAKNTGTYTFRPQDNNNVWPSNAKALHLFVFSNWAAANNTYILNIRTTSGGANLGQVRALVAGVGYSINMNIALDGNGYFYANVAGNATQSSTIRVVGYYV